MFAYLAAPIDAYIGGGEGEETIGINRAAATLALVEAGFAVYDPSKPFSGPRKDSSAVYAVNEAARRKANVMLALWPERASSVGVPMEIQSSHGEGKPLAVCGGLNSLQLEAMSIQRFLPEDVVAAAEWLAECAREGLTSSNGRAGAGAGVEAGRIRWTGDEEMAPEMGLEGDAGFDLYVAEDTTIPYNSFVDVPCGVNIELPPGVWAMITGRSSTIRKRKLLVNTGIIDNGYRGPLFAAVWNMSNATVKVKRGERLAQLIPFPLTAGGLLWHRVAELGASARGTAGFGSTGV